MNNFNKVLLVSTARKALEEYFINSGYLRIPEGEWEQFPEELRQRKPVFISLKRWPGFDFRSSSGNLLGEKSILETVIDKTIAAARHDSIFPLLKPAEISGIVIQVNILGHFRRVTLPGMLQPNQALVVSLGKHTGFFLPELPLLVKWDFEETISQLCLKSGIPGNAWRDKRCRIFSCDCESFTEKKPGALEVMDTEEIYH
jgi:hypothetical protein